MKSIYRIALVALSFFGLAIAFLPTQAHAQSPYGLSAQVDTNELTTDETVRYTLNLTTPDGNAPRLDLPDLEGFNVVGSSTGSQYSIVNGTASSSMVYAFDLQPTRTGDLVIPSLHLTMNGQTLTTDPITVHVSQGTGVPRQRSSQSPFPSSAFGSAFGGMFGNDPFDDPFSNDMFGNRSNLQIQAATDKQSVYVGEPVEYAVQVTSDGMLLGEPEYQAPQFTGFWAHQPPVTRRGANGTVISTLLFPTAAGPLTIDPATIRSDGGFFSNALEEQTEPITIDVKPLPQGAPQEFNGAVGQFEITATPDKLATVVGEPITVRVQVRGTGNLDTLPDPKWQNNADWRSFESKGETLSEVVNGTLAGSRAYERTLIPTKEGILTIPATRYAYFDPADAQYHVVETEAFEVTVAPGDPTLTQTVNPPSANPPADTSNVDTASGISLKPAPTQLTSAAKPLVEQPLFLALFLVPLGFVAVDLAWGWRKRYLQTNAGAIRTSRALKRAQNDLKRAAKAANVYPAVAAVVKRYIEDKLNRSLNGVPHSALTAILVEHELSQDLAARVITALESGETSEYGQMRAAQTDEWIMRTSALLNEVEMEWAE